MPRANAGPRLYWHAPRGCYYIRWYERGEKRVRSTGAVDQREAEKALAAFIGGSHRVAVSGPREPGEIAVSDALTIYAEAHAPMTADPARIAYAIDALVPFWSGRTLADITPSTCDLYRRERGVQPGTARRELGTLAAAINYLHRDGRLTRPVAVPLPAKPPAKDRWLTAPEAARLLNASRHAGRDARQYLPLFIMLGLYTGARKEAILSLRWPQVDLARGRIDFAVPGRKKTKKRRPTVPISRRLLTFLRYAWARRSSDTGTVLHIGGKPIQRIDKGFRAAAARAGLAGVSPHTLRHTAGTWMAQRGAPIWQIAGMLGQTPEVTVSTYAHHHPDHMKQAVEALDRRRG